MKDVQCYELFGGIALKNHAFSFFFSFDSHMLGNAMLGVFSYFFMLIHRKTKTMQ